MAGMIVPTIVESIAKLVGKSAPLLGSVLGSPLASVGISLIANFLGIDAKNKEVLLGALQNDPDIEGKLKKIENEHEETLAKIASTDFANEVTDRSNARLREITLKDYVPTILAVGFLLNYAAIQAYCVTHIGSANDIISARFQDVLIMIMSYYFGSSHKSST
jgi:hypothetical protein